MKYARNIAGMLYLNATLLSLIFVIATTFIAPALIQRAFILAVTFTVAARVGFRFIFKG